MKVNYNLVPFSKQLKYLHDMGVRESIIQHVVHIRMSDIVDSLLESSIKNDRQGLLMADLYCELNCSANQLRNLRNRYPLIQEQYERYKRESSRNLQRNGLNRNHDNRLSIFLLKATHGLSDMDPREYELRKEELELKRESQAQEEKDKTTLISLADVRVAQANPVPRRDIGDISSTK